MVDAGSELTRRGVWHNSWTPARIERVRELAAEKLTVAEIALRMGVSRSAVCGIVHRAGVVLARAVRQTKPNSDGVVRTPREKVAKKPRGPKPLPKEPAPPKELCKPQPVVLREAKDVVPRLIPLFAIKQRDCRWPYGDGPFHFCGCEAASNKPYCSSHVELASRAA